VYKKARPIGLLLLLAMVSSASATTIKPYGFVRFDAIFNDSRMNSPQSPNYVLAESGSTADDSDLSLHPRLSRVGLTMEPEKVGDNTEVTGLIEADFQGGGSESRETPRMRHAWAAIKTGSVEILAGQTWDLISPLYPAANNDALMWNAGNPGDRRPQLRITTTRPAGTGKVRLAAAFGMPNAINSQDLDGNGQLDGLDAATPTVQGLAELTSGKFVIGAWAHFARDQVGPVAADDEGPFPDGIDEETFQAYLVGGHVKVPLGAKAWLQGEGFVGQNASDVRAGIGQGINTATLDEIRTMGGWAEIGVQANEKYRVTVGGTMDKPKQEDLSTGGREKNMAVFLVQNITPVPRVAIGIEYIYWKTEYKGGASGDANRVNAHLTTKF
jgi:hypothetical protein